MGFDFSSFADTEEEKKKKEKGIILGQPFGMPVVGAEPKTPSVKVDFGSFVMPVEEQEEDKIWRINPKTGEKVHTADWKKWAGVGYEPDIKKIKPAKEFLTKTAKDVFVGTPAMIASGAVKGVSESAKTFEKLFNPI